MKFFEYLRCEDLDPVLNVIATHLVTATVGARIGGGKLLLQQWVRWKFSLQQLVRWKFSLQQLVRWKGSGEQKKTLINFCVPRGPPPRGAAEPGPPRHAKIGKNRDGPLRS